MTQTIKYLKIVAIATATIMLIILIKYRPAYEISYNGEIIGYTENKDDFKKLIDNEILGTDEENVAFVALDNVNYKLEFINRSMCNGKEALNILKENAKKVYRIYEIANSDDTNAVYVNSAEEAEELAENLKEQYSEIEPDLKITTLYLDEKVTEESIKEAKTKITEELNEKLQEKKEIESKTVNGIYLACTPVTGTISSRFGSRESIRDHTHKGIDIAARYGADIKSTADGTVKYSGWNDGGYGNLVIIDHGNGIETYYGHCSKVCVSVGQTVNAGDVIAKVGSTGNSTGNHLHFEIRIDGTQVNPQNYLYN